MDSFYSSYNVFIPDEYYSRDSDERNIIRIMVEKNRQGEVCQFKLAWKPEYCRVAD